ncbi:MAG: N-succinylarginine dihydrolase [Gammaproteobacteria bacterium]|nr:N-succinylarginine dihydrolase [Gammaproteobacteria bacterium]
MSYIEYNFDGLVGLSHHYGGHSFGNVASSANKAAVSNPKQAALQGLKKAKALAQMGLESGTWGQAILPPQERPFLPALRQLGFSGSNADVITKSAKAYPQIFAKTCSAASMWTANAATISPSLDASDNKVHFTPANLVTMYHRALEHETTANVLQAIFADTSYFVHHKTLPQNMIYGDEGAANHTRFYSNHSEPGVEFFVYGAASFSGSSVSVKPANYPARQTLEASSIIARSHNLAADKVVFAQQHPDAIDAGVFHNDVIAVGHGNFMMCHEMAFLNKEATYAALKSAFSGKLYIHEVSNNDLPIEDVVSSYLFNSQLIGDAENGMFIVAPQECVDNMRVKSAIDNIIAGDNPVRGVHFFDVKQSMRNGGGPACLRLRVLLSQQEIDAVSARVVLDDALYSDLTTWIESHYRDQLTINDMADPKFYEEGCAALDELTQIMRLGSVYDFQRV